MEDGLNMFEIGRQPQFLGNGRQPQFLGNSRHLNFWNMEDNPKQLKVKAMVVAPLRVTLYKVYTRCI